jgi:thiamine pyrophosphate-dependent acetolactate synthase large subunit-like protein
MTAMAAQAASKRGVAVLIVPVDVSSAKAPDEPAFAVHRAGTGHPPQRCGTGSDRSRAG